MTTQTKQFIELTDIVAFRFNCKNCGSTLSLPVSDERTRLVLDLCPNCKTQWAMTHGIAPDQFILGFREALKRIQATMVKDSKLEFTMMLEIAPEAEPPAKPTSVQGFDERDLTG